MMNVINLVFGTFFGLLMRLCHMLTGNFGWTIIVFTLLTKVVLFPISLISQKNSIILVKIQPLLADLQARYGDDVSTLVKEQKALYKHERYSAMKAILPLLVQIPLIVGVISVVNAPTKYIGANIDPVFLGIDLFALPNGLLVPILAITSTMLLCVVQNIYNVVSREQGFIGKWGVTVFLVAFTGWFSFVCLSAVGLYWTFSNLFSIVVLAICNLIYNPKKYIDYDNRSVKSKRTKAEKAAARERKEREKAREKEDMQRFYDIKKELVFYSESSGFYKYFQHFIEYILAHSDITVHYLTSDIDDQVFSIDKPHFETYFCSANGLITAFMKMEADVVAMSMPDLEVYHYKRSLVRKDIEYIYIDHGMGSFNLMLREGALNHFDTIFCYGKNHNEEILAMERLYNLPVKKLVNTGFGLLDMLIEAYENTGRQRHEKPQILIAPSWQKDNILEYCLSPLLEELFKMDAKIIIRPHPEFVKRFPGKIKSLQDKYAGEIGAGMELQTDFSSNSTVYDSDLVITDWSSIAQEFSFATKKPSLFINTPMKVMNTEWRSIGVEPMEIWIRDRIGVSVDPDKLGSLGETIQRLIDNNNNYKSAIEDLLANHMYNAGYTAEVGGEYIIGQIKERRLIQNA